MALLCTISMQQYRLFCNFQSPLHFKAFNLWAQILFMLTVLLTRQHISQLERILLPLEKMTWSDHISSGCHHRGDILDPDSARYLSFGATFKHVRSLVCQSNFELERWYSTFWPHRPDEWHEASLQAISCTGLGPHFWTGPCSALAGSCRCKSVPVYPDQAPHCLSLAPCFLSPAPHFGIRPHATLALLAQIGFCITSAHPCAPGSVHTLSWFSPTHLD